MDKSDFSKARVGDRVYSPFGPECPIGGTNGKVISVWGDNTIEVMFDNQVEKGFWRTGCYHDKDSAPSCFHCRPAIDIPPPPKWTKKVKIEVRPFKFGNHVGFSLDATLEEDESFYCGPVQTIEVEVDDD